MGLDFGHTRPDIDKGIKIVKQIIEDHLNDLIKEICPVLSDDTLTEIRDDWAESIYNAVAHEIESIRETNENMRKQADSQIDDLEAENYELNQEIASLNEQISELEQSE